MSGGSMPTHPTSASKNFSSTPVKTIDGKEFPASKGLGEDILSDDEDTFSLLSPIYHDSFDSEGEEEDLESVPAGKTSPTQSDHSSCELPKTPSGQMLGAAVQPSASPSLSAWEMWLVNKAKEDRIKLEQKAEEERLRKEKQEQQEIQQKHKSIVGEEKIHEWLKMKREKEKHEQLRKQKKATEELQRQQQKQKEVEQKAQQKYKDWLQKKHHEQTEKEKKEKEEAALKEEQEKERRRRAEEKFKEWVAQANEKSRASPKSPHHHPRSPYDKSYPSPSFYNPIPWKPIHVPPPEPSPTAASSQKLQKQKKNPQSSSSSSVRLRNAASAARTLHKR